MSFDGTNYEEFAAFIRIYMLVFDFGVFLPMRSHVRHAPLLLCLIPRPVPHALTADATQVAQDAAKTAEAAADDVIGQICPIFR
jgi:hypothetical protein